jgi:predicted 2-oxoglutarate/Fe(II)-dependent dioxygenase YbiX
MNLYNWYFLKSVYSVDECKEILDFCEKNKSSYLIDGHTSEKKVSTFVVETDKLENKLNKFFVSIHKTNNMYFGYELFKEKPIGVNINVYENENNEYPYHQDVNKPGTMSDLKLTAILNLSLKPYKGGDFCMFLGQDYKVEEINEPGNILIFPSFLYHKVTPVTEGQRITLSAWLEGPNFK